MIKEYVECDCSCSEHTLRFTWDEEPDWRAEIYLDVFLNQYNGFFKRIWLAFKYIFGFKSRYGHFDEAILSQGNVTELRDLCNRFVEAHPIPDTTLENKIKIAKRIVAYSEKNLEKAKEELLKIKEDKENE